MTGQWEVYVPQASIRYEFEKGTKWRVEAGKFTSPIGLGMTENRASVNDGVIWWHRGYYSFLPAIGGGAAPHALIASIYPMGAQVTRSAQGASVNGLTVSNSSIGISLSTTASS